MFDVIDSYVPALLLYLRKSGNWNLCEALTTVYEWFEGEDGIDEEQLARMIAV